MYMYAHTPIYIHLKKIIYAYTLTMQTHLSSVSPKALGVWLLGGQGTWEGPSNFLCFGSSLSVFSLEMAHRAVLRSVAFTKSLSTAQKTTEDRCEGTVLGLRDCKQGTLVTEDFTSGIESEEKSLTIKWHTLYSWQAERNIVVLNNIIVIPGCWQWPGFWANGLVPCCCLDITWSTSQKYLYLPIFNCSQQSLLYVTKWNF